MGTNRLIDQLGVAIAPEILAPLAARMLRARRRAEGRTVGFHDWLRLASPELDWEARHLRYMIDQLEAVTRGDIKRLMIQAPPRHGKSWLATIHYPVWRFERDPSFKVCIGSYNATKAADFGRKARRIAERRIPSLDPRRQSATDWQTLEGGVYRSVGVGNPPMGEGFHLIVIDDPIKKFAEAHSLAARDRIWSWYESDMQSRLEPDGAIIIVAHRWHEDDLAGRMLESEDAASWTIVNLPAIAEDNDPLGRVQGEALWPERWPVDELEARQRGMLPSTRAALYQGRPTTPQGHMLPVQKIKRCRRGDVPKDLKKGRAWDLAGTELARADYTAGACGEGPDPQGNIYLSDMVRGQWEVSERNKIMLATAGRDGVKTKVRIPRDHKGDVGKEIVGNIKRLLTGYAVQDVAPVGRKDALRAEPLATAMGNGQVYLVEDDWIEYWERGKQITGKAARDIYVDELSAFPRSGRHDDQVDATCDVFSMLSRPTEPVHL